VIGVGVAKKIWDTLHLAHEGVDKVRKARIDLMMSKLNQLLSWMEKDHKRCLID
jgi:hypothetical protein